MAVIIYYKTDRTNKALIKDQQDDLKIIKTIPFRSVKYQYPQGTGILRNKTDSKEYF